MAFGDVKQGGQNKSEGVEGLLERRTNAGG